MHIGRAAIASLGVVMESDEAMALLFDVAAIQLRCSLPEDVSRVEIPLKSVVLLADRATAGLHSLPTSSEQQSALKYGTATSANDARLREELLLLIEVCSAFVLNCALQCSVSVNTRMCI